MAPRAGRRQAPEEDATPTQRRRRDDTLEDGEDVDMEGTQQDTGSGSLVQLSKGLVRYALSCEHSRKPIKRQDINEKSEGHVKKPLATLTIAVLGSHTRVFKDVFNRANAELMDVFGMQLVELPKAERVTMRQKRAAAASNSQSTSTSLWVLQTILPEQYRLPEVMGPSRPVPDDQINTEDSYVGLYTVTIALITISGGMIAEGKLDRALRRMNADQLTPLGTKDKTITQMIKDGYIVRVKDTSSGEETVEYIVGPRGKVEVGRDGVANFVRMMYGEGGGEIEDLERRIDRTLNVAEAFNSTGAPPEPAAAGSQGAGRKRGRRREGEDEDEDA